MDYNLSTLEQTHFKYVFVGMTGKLRRAKESDIISTMSNFCFVYYPKNDIVNVKLECGVSLIELNEEERVNEVQYTLNEFGRSPIFIDRNMVEVRRVNRTTGEYQDLWITK